MKKIAGVVIAACLLMSCFSAVFAYAEDSALTMVDGYYELDSPEDLIAFQELINSGLAYGAESNAKLTADIDMAGQSWRPIDEFGLLGGYAGIFDGQGHTISNLTFKSRYDASLFGVLGGATIKDLGMVNVDMQGANAAGIALYFVNDDDTVNTITDCYATGNISGSYEVGGLVAAAGNYGTNSISNSYFYGTLNQSGSTEDTGGIIGRVTSYAHLTLSNCYFNGADGRAYGTSCEVDKFVVVTNVQCVTDAEFENGKVAYLLKRNGGTVFGQNIGTDASPVFSGPEVYYHNVNCTDYTYTNASEPNYDHKVLDEVCIFCGTDFHRHVYNKDGVCACGDTTHAHVYDENEVCSCGVICPGEDSDGDGFIEIGTAEQLSKFRDSVNHTTPFKNANAILTADIVYNADVLNGNYGLNGSDFKQWEPLDSFAGIFDGCGYTVYGLYNTRGSVMDAAFTVELAEDGIIRNLNIADSYVGGTYTVGGFAAECRGMIENSSFDGFVCSKDGEAEAGGLVGYSYKTASIVNCYYLGKVQVEGGVMGGIVGMDVNTLIKNCYFAGTLSNSSGTAIVYAIAVNGSKCKNCYFDSTKVGKYITGSNLGNKECFGKTTSQFSSGELVQYLGDAYGQTVGEDATPVIGGPEVFYGHKDCLSTQKDYGNEIRYERPIDNHLAMSDDGFCSSCNRSQEGTLNADGVYEISNIGQLFWLSEEVNGGDNTINAVLVNDIVLNEDVLTDDGLLNRGIFTLWKPIGNTSSAYNGIFDGNGHTVSGLYYSDVNGLCVGLFGCVGARGVVRNVTVADSYLLGKNAVGAVAGYNAGVIENCINASSVIGGAATDAIAGLNDGTVENCTDNGWVTSDDALNGGTIGGTQGGESSGGGSPDAGDKNDILIWSLMLGIVVAAATVISKKRLRSI